MKPNIKKSIRQKTPTVSVMMCAYNAAPFIRDSIDSILAQTYKNFEFVIIDDGSTDETLSIIQSYDDKRIRLIKSRHDYILSLNKGLKACQGEFIARMDADDKAMPERLAEQIKIMRKYPEITACFTWGTTFGSLQESIGHVAKGHIDNVYFWLLTGNFFMHPTAMLRKDFLIKYRLRYKRYPYAEDYKLWSDIARLGGEFYIIPEPLFHYRLGATQVSQKHHEQQKKTRLLIQQEILEELLHRLEHPYKQHIKRLYNAALKMNTAHILQGDEVIVWMYKILRRTKCFV